METTNTTTETPNPTIETPNKTILAVIGKAGAGKSSLCNLLVGKPHFNVGDNMMEGVT